jgi:hypothetical protein
MKIRNSLAMQAVALAVLTVVHSALAQGHAPGSVTNVFSITDAAFDDGAALDGFFSISSDIHGQSASLVSADLTVGSSAGWTGIEYLFNVPGQTDTAAIPTGPEAAPPPGDSEFILDAPTSGNDYYRLYFQFQSTDPTILVSVNEVLFSDLGGPAISSHLIAPNSSIGSPGNIEIVATPEPSVLTLASLGAFGLFAYRRKLGVCP